MQAHNKALKFLCFVLLTLGIAGCNSKTVSPQQSEAQSEKQSNGSELLVVDCLLPGQLRKLGQGLTYLTQRRPIKTSAVDCEIRGGEYVAYDRADYKTALNIWLPLAKQGDPEAQAYVGEIYEKGFGLEPDYTVAAQWYKKAAAQSNSRAQINLGYLYEKGLGVNQNLVEALNWYRKASGLEEEDIAYASTIETAVKAEYEDELKILRKELDNSNAEIASLQSELDKSRNNYYREQEKLNQLRAQQNSTNTQLTELKQTEGVSNSSNIKAYEKQLQADTAKLNQQLKVVEQIKTNLNQNNSELTVKLKQAERRGVQLSEELVKYQQEEGQLKAELVDLQTQLTRANLSIVQLKDSSVAEQQKIDQEKNELIHLKEQMNDQRQSEFSGVKAELAQREKELEERHQTIKKLELEKAQLTREKNELAAGSSKTVVEKDQELNSLNKNLLQQNQGLEEQKLIIARLEQEKEQAILNEQKIELAKNEEFLVSHEQIKQLEAQLAAREQTLEKQRSQIKAMEKDRLVYEQKIKNIQSEEGANLAQTKPSIEILEPPFTLTRNKNMPTVKLRSAMSHREITGRVNAPAGILSFNVNGLNEKINSSGLFKSMVKLNSDETVVKTVAIDRAGNKAELEFLLLSAGVSAAPIDVDETDVNEISAQGSSGVDFGSYYALVIGNQKYDHFPNLDTPVNDAKTVEKILREKYGFKTTLVINANRYDILSALNKYRSKLTEADNLLVYYAGHGELDRVNLRGHWLPVDAEADNTANWISTVAITDVLNAMSAKHVLVVADSCYSGAMTRASMARLEAGMTEQLRLKWLRLMSKTRSRTVLTSGGLKPVLDSGLNGHSIFANAFIEAISDNRQILEGQALYRKVYDQLMKVTKRLNFDQVPQYAPIKHGGHEAGDFFLVAR